MINRQPKKPPSALAIKQMIRARREATVPGFVGRRTSPAASAKSTDMDKAKYLITLAKTPEELAQAIQIAAKVEQVLLKQQQRAIPQVDPRHQPRMAKVMAQVPGLRPRQPIYSR